jgi:ATP-binding cassette subfamily F protein 3
VQPSNFLLLDEPTNHLDMRAKDVLLRALLDFTGTVVFVSHDRYFIDKLATKVFAVGGGEVLAYPGNYEDYLWRMRRDAEQLEEQPEAGISASLQAALAHAADEQNGGSQPSSKKRMNPLQADRLREELAAIEREIAEREQQSAALQKQLGGGFKDHQQSTDILERMETLRREIQTREGKWEELSEKLEAEA